MATTYRYRHGPLILFAILASLEMLGPRAIAAEISDHAHGFFFKVPEGFTPDPELAKSTPDVLHALVGGNVEEDGVPTILFIELMGGTIGPERLKPKNMPPNFQGRLFTVNWRAFTVDAFEFSERVGEVDTITYIVQIPLKRNAIQVKLFGPARRKSDLSLLLTSFLDGLHGESNWLQSAPIPFTYGTISNYGMVLLAFAVVFVLAGLVALYFVSRNSPKGTVLAISAAIYVGSFMLDGTRIREVVMLTGAARMLGFAGGILGIIDLVRNRQPRDQAASSIAPPPNDSAGSQKMP